MAFQAIQNIEVIVDDNDILPRTVVTVNLHDLCASLEIAATVAVRDGMTDTAQRMRNDVKVLSSLEPGNWIIVA